MLNMDRVRNSATRVTGQEGLLGWADAGSSLLSAGHELGEPQILFTKIEDSMIDEQLELLRRSDAEPTEAQPETSFEPLGEEIAYEDFAKLDMRVGTVVTAEPVKGADRLLRLEVDLGFEQRQVVAGIAEQFKPENLSGRKVVVVANLKPRKLRGLESQGMILMAEDREGRLSFLQSDGEPGSKVS